MTRTWLDKSPAGVVAGCHLCPSWREHRPTRGQAAAAALAHARAVHGSKSEAARHAATRVLEA